MNSENHTPHATHRILWITWAIAVLGLPFLSLALAFVMHLLTSLVLAIHYHRTQSEFHSKLPSKSIATALLFAGWMTMWALLLAGCNPRFP